MANLSEEEIKAALNGHEVQSLEYEGTVEVKKGRVYRDGDDITEQVNWATLWDEHTENELGSNWKEHLREAL